MSEGVELLTVAYGVRVGMGERKKDHAVTREEFDKGNEGRTLCGRPLGKWYFPRATSGSWAGGGTPSYAFLNRYSFECSICRGKATKLGWRVKT